VGSPGLQADFSFCQVTHFMDDAQPRLPVGNGAIPIRLGLQNCPDTLHFFGRDTRQIRLQKLGIRERQAQAFGAVRDEIHLGY
jgi:hypothetical protein